MPNSATIEQPLQLALKHHQRGQWQQAQALYEQILSRTPDQPDALHLLGLVAFQTNHHQRAAELIRRATAVRPAATYYNSLGAVLIELGQADEALTAFDKAIELQPDYAEAHNNRGNALLKQRRGERAIAAYQAAIRIKPDYAQAYSNLAHSLHLQGAWTAAAEACRKAISLAPQSAEAHHNLGMILAVQGQYAQAVAELQRAIELRPQFPAACNSLGNAYKGLGDLTAAEEAYRNAIALNATDAMVYHNLGELLVARGEHDAAAKAYQQAIGLQPTFASGHRALGDLYRSQGRQVEAVACYQEALKSAPYEPQIHYGLAQTYRDLGKIDAAVASLRKVIQFKVNCAGEHSELLCLLQNHPGHDQDTIRQERRIWQQRHIKRAARRGPAGQDMPAAHLLIGILSCAKLEHRRQWIRDTWLRGCSDQPQVQAFFYAGAKGRPPRREGDVIYLDCGDAYEDQMEKVWAFYRYCLANFDFAYLLQCDDDSYVQLDRLLRAGFEAHPYTGCAFMGADERYHIGKTERELGPIKHEYRGPFAAGGGMILSRECVELLVAYEGALRNELLFDKAVGDILRMYGIRMHWDRRFKIIRGDQRIAPENDVIINHYLERREDFVAIYQAMGRPK